MRLNVPIPDDLYLIYKNKVGNISQDILDYVNTIAQISNEYSEIISEINKKEKEQERLVAEINILKDRLNKIQNKNTEIEQEQLNFDPFAHLESKAKLNSVQFTIYRIQKGRFIPDWATKRMPDNPEEYALKVLKRLEKQLKGDEQ